MSDLIRRENAIDALKKIMFTHLFECGEYIGEDTREFNIVNAEKALEVIEEIPSAELERKWIPVSEALPEKKEMVLITNNKGHVKCGQYQGTFDDKNRWWWKHNTLEKVLAWMPLPEPWRGEK